MYIEKTKKKPKTGLAVFVLVGFAASLAAMSWISWAYVKSWGQTPVTLSHEVIIELKPTESLKTLAQKLSDEGLVDQALIFQVWARIRGTYSKYQAGRYLFKNSVTPQDIELTMTRGQTYQPVVVQITIPEGFNLKQIVDRLVANKIGETRQLLKLVRDPIFIKELGLEAKSLEGYIYPATYPFSEVPSPKQFFAKAVETFFQRLPHNFETEVAKKNLTLNDAVIFASLIELETKFEDEKNAVSEVIWNRLNRGEPLGIDAAVIYGVERYDGNLRTRDLKNAKNPYNTRIHKGLPPSAIGSVSGSSLQAIFKPTNIGYYYYVLIPGSEGRHHFSKTLKEHNIFVQDLIKYHKKNGHY